MPTRHNAHARRPFYLPLFTSPCARFFLSLRLRPARERCFKVLTGDMCTRPHTLPSIPAKKRIDRFLIRSASMLTAKHSQKPRCTRLLIRPPHACLPLLRPSLVQMHLPEGSGKKPVGDPPPPFILFLLFFLARPRTAGILVRCLCISVRVSTRSVPAYPAPVLAQIIGSSPSPRSPSSPLSLTTRVNLLVAIDQQERLRSALHSFARPLSLFASLSRLRTWYMRLLELGRPIPKTFEDYLLQAETDRPYTIRLPYGETFYNYEIEASREKAKRRHRERERNGEYADLHTTTTHNNNNSRFLQTTSSVFSRVPLAPCGTSSLSSSLALLFFERRDVVLLSLSLCVRSFLTVARIFENLQLPSRLARPRPYTPPFKSSCHFLCPLTFFKRGVAPVSPLLLSSRFSCNFASSVRTSFPSVVSSASSCTLLSSFCLYAPALVLAFVSTAVSLRRRFVYTRSLRVRVRIEKERAVGAVCTERKAGGLLWGSAWER